MSTLDIVVIVVLVLCLGLVVFWAGMHVGCAIKEGEEKSAGGIVLIGIIVAFSLWLLLAVGRLAVGRDRVLFPDDYKENE